MLIPHIKLEIERSLFNNDKTMKVWGLKTKQGELMSQIMYEKTPTRIKVCLKKNKAKKKLTVQPKD